MKRNAYNKDIRRSIWKSKKRFLSILIITALGVTVLTGIYAAVQDMYHSADRFYDEQRLFDIRVLSTLGLTDEDVDALQAVSGIETADGAYSETVHTEVAGVRQSAELTVLSAKGLNTPYVLQGALPAAAGEIAVTEAYMAASGKTVGDTLTLEETLEEAEDAEKKPKAEKNAGRENEGEDGEDGIDTDIDWDTEVEVEAAETPNFLNTTYTITGVVLDPMDINNSNGSMSFRSTATADYTFFITPADVDTEVYTAVYLSLAGMTPLNCYSAEYEATVGAVIQLIESQIMRQREQARYNAVMADALDTLADAESTMQEKFEEADELFADAWADIEQAKRDLVDGAATLTQEERDALQKLADAQAQLEEGKEKLRQAEAELEKNAAELEAYAKQIAQGRQQFEAERQNALEQFAATEQRFADEQAAINTGRGQVLAQADQLKAAIGSSSWPTPQWDALVGAATAAARDLILASPGTTPSASTVAAAIPAATINDLRDTVTGLGFGSYAQGCVDAAIALGCVEGGQQALDLQKSAYETQKAAALQLLAEKEAELAGYEAMIEESRQKIAEGRAEIERQWKTLAEGEAELNEEEAKALKELADAWRELAEGRQELAEGEAELAASQAEYQEKKTEAEQKLADAYEELQDISMTEWYVQDRSSLSSFSSMKNDMNSIEAVGNAFPIVFLVVAILIGLTTMTRMVEEDRGLIGTYKALGFSDGAIYKKYILYALLACLLGGLLGDFLGFVILPLFLSTILNALYILPYFILRFNWLYGVGGVVLFTTSIVGATWLACRGELGRMPATLMRPKAPRAGSRVLLEHLPFIWNRLKFLNKVTLRNLFRYKKRLFMTVAGIMGCTALVLAGFAIKDSVTDLMPKQYDQVYHYDLMTVVDSEDNEELLGLMDSGDVADYINLQISSAKVLGANGAAEDVQLMVIPTGAVLEDYISLPGRGGAPAQLTDTGVLITQNAAELLGLNKGGTATLQTLQLDQYGVTISDVVENYLGNNIYMTQALYESLVGPFEANGVLAHLADTVQNHTTFSDGLLENDIVLSSVSTEAIKADFSSNFALINSVVYVLILLAAGLAFVVLFTLSNTNISERVRELATIKVLGFFDGEVHSYVNKETLILTVIGVLAGLPVGRMISGLLTEALKMPSLYFAVSVHPLSYLVAGAISFSFALVVNLMTNRTLDRINMVEALKSVE